MFQRNASLRRKVPASRKFESAILVGRTGTGDRVYDPHNITSSLRDSGAIAEVGRALRSLFLGHEERLIVEICDGERKRDPKNGRLLAPSRHTELTDEDLLSDAPLPTRKTTAHRFLVVRQARCTAILLPA